MTTATQAETVRDSKDNMEGVRSMVKTMSTKAATKKVARTDNEQG